MSSRVKRDVCCFVWEGFFLLELFVINWTELWRPKDATVALEPNLLCWGFIV